MTSISDFARIGNPDAPVGSPEWCLAAHLNLRIHKRNHDAEVSSLKYGLREFKGDERWRQLTDRNGRKFNHWKAYVQCPEPYGLGMPIEDAEAVIEADDKHRLRDILGKHGGDRKSEAIKDQPDIISSKYGTSVKYILARLDRDGHAELAIKVRSGTMSANAAAIEAGFRTLHPLSELRRAWKRASVEDRAIFRAEIADD